MIYRGGCLCGAIRFEATGAAEKPHTCSCKFCQRHTGALTASWVEFSARTSRGPVQAEHPPPIARRSIPAGLSAPHAEVHSAHWMTSPWSPF